MKLSIKSLISLDFESCHMLGAFLKRKKINIRLSQTVNHDAILKMFKALDTDKNGYLDLNEFSVAFNCFRNFNTGITVARGSGILLNPYQSQPIQQLNTPSVTASNSGTNSSNTGSTASGGQGRGKLAGTAATATSDKLPPLSTMAPKRKSKTFDYTRQNRFNLDQVHQLIYLTGQAIQLNLV